MGYRSMHGILANMNGVEKSLKKIEDAETKKAIVYILNAMRGMLVEIEEKE